MFYLPQFIGFFETRKQNIEAVQYWILDGFFLRQIMSAKYQMLYILWYVFLWAHNESYFITEYLLVCLLPIGFSNFIHPRGHYV